MIAARAEGGREALRVPGRSHDQCCGGSSEATVTGGRPLEASSPGTGGSSGASYLKMTLDKKFFPELWEARTMLTEI